MTTATTRLTAEGFAERYADTSFVELVRGEVAHLSPGGLDHSRASTNAAYLLQSWARRTRLGRVFSNEAGLITQRDPDTVRGADVVYISYARIPKGEGPAGFCSIAPDLVVEVIGKGQGWDEFVSKAEEYLRMGVQRAWVLDADARTVHVFRPGQSPQRFSEAEILRDEIVLPEFSCGVAEFFED